MADTTRSPQILNVSWGRMEVEGGKAPYRDAKLYPGGSREWDWRETGTGHTQGIRPGDVLELLDRGATVVVLSSGFHGRLGTCPETLELLEKKGVEAHVLQTEQAVATYNELARNTKVGGLFHTTC